MKRPATSKGLKRLDRKLFVATNTLDTYVTEKTANIFDVLMDNGKSVAMESFLQKEPNQWPEDPTYKMLKNKAEQTKVVNDCAERGIALIQQYSQTLTKDETQKQYLLCLVDLHRKAYPEPSKDPWLKSESKISFCCIICIVFECELMPTITIYCFK